MYQRTLTDHFHTWCQYLNNFVISYSFYINIYVGVNFFISGNYIFLLLFLGMVKYAKEVETKEKEILPEIKNKLQHISDWIYVNMASVSLYRSSAKYVLGTKTLTLPTQDTGRLSTPPTELCNYHDNHSQKRFDSVGYSKVRTRYLPVKASSEHCLSLKELCQHSPLPAPLVLPPPPDLHTHF